MASIEELYREFKAAGGGSSGSRVSAADYLAANEQTVQRTFDGDTLESTKPGRKLAGSIRFAGIDAPESAQGSLGKAAQDWLDEQLKDSPKVSLGAAVEDKHGRRVSTVYANGKNLNVELVRAGHAKVYDRYLDDFSKPFKKALLNAQEEAKQAKRGVWGDGVDLEDPEAFRRSQAALYGAKAGAMGHETRPRRDGEVRSVAELYREFKAHRSGVSLRGGLPQAQGQGLGGERSGGDGEEPGFLDSVLQGLDYAGNASRSTLKGLLEPGGGLGRGLDYGAQALRKTRSTTASQLKDTVTGRLGLGKVRAGADDGEFQFGDVADVGADLVVDIVTDPITWATFGANRLLKGASQLAKGSRDLKLGLSTKEAARFAKVHAGARAGLGGLYGYGAVDDDGDWLDKVGGSAIGAGLGLAAGPAMARAGEGLRKNFDKVTNWYATKTRGSSFGDLANQMMVAKGGYDKRRNIAEWIRQGRLKALEELDPAERLEATQIMQTLKTATIKKRNELMETLPEGISEAQRLAAENAFTRQANDFAEQNVLPGILAEKGEKLGKAVAGWAKHNENVIKKLNRDAFGLADGAADEATGKGIVGLRFHIDDVYKLEDLKAAEDGLLNFQIHRAKSEARSQAAEKLGPDFSYAVYAENFAKKFLSDAEIKAADLVRQYREAPIAGKGLVAGYAKAAEPVLRKLDPLTNWIKTNMLYFSMSWLKNNYFDNLAKSYVENGLGGIVDAATTGAFRKGVSKDVWNLYKGNFERAYKSADFQDALNLGVLDNPMFKAMSNEMTRDFLFRPEQITQATDKTLANYLNKARELWFTKNPVISLMGSVGTYMEGTARFTTYIRALESLKASKAMAGVSERSLKEMAAKIARDTFFDYADVSALENAVFKRLVPFYSFYSKNLPYWMQATFDPARAGRILALEKIRANIGREPTEYEKQGMTPYLADNAPRSLGKDDKGNERYLIVPSSSAHEAMKNLNPKDWLNQLVEKGTPIPKVMFELATGKDTFTGDDLYPTAAPGKDPNDAKKFLFSRGFKWYAARRALESLGFDPDGTFQKLAGTAGVDVDKNGNPYTKQGWTIVLDRVLSTVMPHGFVDQVAGQIGKVGYGKDDLDDVIANLTLPMQQVKVSPDFARMVRQRKAEGKE